ncbi:phospho-sugar mutase [Agromyces sp. MMS24-JH15]|uniref:phospho-sugar mutase n=1 Tax=Agromyces sp. MMS24-JH15 TaxID=3243765 RepID=UPI003749893A
MSRTDAERIALAEAWIDQDPDQETRAELAAIVDAARGGDDAASADLADRFDHRLEFGTAGLRGVIAAGPNRMNRVLVSQAAAGLAAYLLEHAAPGEQPSVVIGYDGRKNSEVFAHDSAEIIAGAGVRAVLLPRLLPTPLVAFAVRHLGTSAGVMVTASHNPPHDNGYKVYLGSDDHGSQIVPPADAGIAAHILRIAESVRVPDLPRGSYETAPESVVEEYVARAAAVAVPPSSADAEPLTVYTAMHGVGWETMSRVLTTAGYREPVLVEAQIAPDARFPTVSFPNPEEPGALDLSFARAIEAGAELIIANDPDADRLAIGIPDGSGGYRRLLGNEVGLLLGWEAAERAAARAGEGGPDGSLACSIVSSPGLAAIAEAYGLEFHATLTGFKWISRAPGLVFGFEEALGYLFNPDDVRDKDGISAAMAFLSIATRLKAQGRTIADHLDDFVERFGCHASGQISVRVEDLSRIGAIMAKLRAEPPSEIGGIRVERIEDLIDGFGDLPPSDVLRILLADGSRVMVRPSGTEPKLKIYIDSVSEQGSVAERRDAATSAVAALDAGMRELVDD